MSKTHDENKDLRSLSKVAKISYGDKTIRASRTANIGIRRLGAIDFLTKYRGWIFIYDNSAGIGGYFGSNETKKSVRDIKHEKKTPKLTDKTKRK